MNIVVTGATSFIGSHMAKRLAGEENRVYAVVRPGSENMGKLDSSVPGLRIIELELSELGRLPELIGEACHWFFHFGWDGSGSNNRMNRVLQQQNARDSLSALEAARQLGCKRFLFSGSQAEYGIHQTRLTEETECNPLSEYGKAKVDFMREAMAAVEGWKDSGEYEMDYIHTRIFSIYGPGDHPWSLVESCIKAFADGEYISLGECTQMWNFLYIDDLIRALELLMERAAPGIYNVAGPESETRVLREYVRDLYEVCGYHGSYSFGRRPQNAEGPANLIPDAGKLFAETEWQAKVTFREGIKRMLSKPAIDNKEFL